MEILKYTDNIYGVQGYAGHLSGTKVQRLLYEGLGLKVSIDDWEINIDTLTIGTDLISNAIITRRKKQ